ncbi:flagellar protein FliS [Alphaproteobacteria bacterium]|jgi:flagellar secretion chaperone FliS|nr:flagellar protein FliS [Alphaproteobacteria bacterium]MBT5799405.1 flagellar protein FliS [Alphaproteobacteria bacterium]MDC0461696.1 flagellar protein FliS [Alphaproteobacteria bacterium]MDC3312240.1 flagellar protein FliS [Alphaproteobacteria bacterium]
MNYNKMLDAYSNSEKKAVIEAEDSHSMVLLLFDELIKSIRIFSENIDPKTADLELRSVKMSKSLTIIYALQSSLDFEKGGEIAENLFRLYEYAREQILIDHKSGVAEGVLVAISSLEDIREAWVEIRSIL